MLVKESVCLCLHFDINKTLIMSDASSGKNIDMALNSILSECVWGEVDITKPISDRTAADWIPCVEHPSTLPPSPTALTFGTYLEDYTLIPKKEQTKLKRSFTESGSIGANYRPFLQELDTLLKYPTTDTPSHHLSLEYLRGGYYHIIPAFFRLIDFLAEENLDFRIVFRTFGDDLINVCEEFNLFCEGKHPAYKGRYRFDGTDLTLAQRRDLRVELPRHTGKLLRTADGSTGLHLGYVRTTPSTTATSDADGDSVSVATIASGALEVHRIIMEDWLGLPSKFNGSKIHPRSKFTAALQDDFQWWHAHGESNDSGKLLLIDTDERGNSEDGDKLVLHCFFDDNIERDRPHIIDVRDSRTFDPVPFSLSNGKYLRRVEPYAAITDHDYYIKEVKLLLIENYGIQL